jgi:NADH-quinone oxidoreductase subunit N
MVDATTIGLLASEIILIGVAAFVIVAGAFSPKSSRWWPIFGAICFAVVLGSFGILNRFTADSLMQSSGIPAFSGPLVVDYFSTLTRQAVLVLGLLFALLFWRRDHDQLASERMGLLVIMMVGLMIVAQANDLVVMFLGLEMVSIPTYVMLFLGRRDRAGMEATAKYFFLSILSSALLLYGFSFLYGLGGTTRMVGTDSIATALASAASSSPLVPIALILILAGLGFKAGAVPFHFYAPDVYQGATNYNAGLLAIVPKIASFAAMARLIVGLVPAGYDFGWQLPLGLAVATMSLGNVCALWQRNIRRMLAYSSIAHTGYLLMGVASAVALSRSYGVSAMTFYLMAYSLTSLTVFAALTHLESENKSVDRIEDLSGLGLTNPIVAGAIAIAMFSFGGIPIFAGFWGKYGLFTSALQLVQLESPMSRWFLILAVAGAINAAVAAAYYLRIVAIMFFDTSRAALPAAGGMGPFSSMLASVLLVLGIGLFPGATMQRAQIADESMPHGPNLGSMPDAPRGVRTLGSITPSGATPSGETQGQTASDGSRSAGSLAVSQASGDDRLPHAEP